MMSRLTAVIVSYRSEGVLEACLSALPDDLAVIVVDNNSPTTPDLILSRHKAPTRLIGMGYNAGFGRAANRGLAEVRTPFAILINPDVEISAPIMDRMIGLMDANPNLAILSPKFVEERGDLRSAPGHLRLEHQPMVIGAAMMLRCASFAGSGYFDERIFLFGEDDDLCLSARGRGLDVAMAPDLLVLHPGGESTDVLAEESPAKERIKATSYAYVIKKHDPRGRRAILRKTLLYVWHGLTSAARLRLHAARVRFARASGCLDYLIWGKGALWTNHLTDTRFRLTAPKEPHP